MQSTMPPTALPTMLPTTCSSWGGPRVLRAARVSTQLQVLLLSLPFYAFPLALAGPSRPIPHCSRVTKTALVWMPRCRRVTWTAHFYVLYFHPNLHSRAVLSFARAQADLLVTLPRTATQIVDRPRIADLLLNPHCLQVTRAVRPRHCPVTIPATALSFASLAFLSFDEF